MIHHFNPILPQTLAQGIDLAAEAGEIRADA